MFEQELKEISRRVFKDKRLREYFILSYKKHSRDLYFKSKDREALKFAKQKFNSRKKKVIYFFLEIGLLQKFLKKIKLSESLGEVIFVGGQIKGFDLKNKEVLSFPRKEASPFNFIDSKRIQKQLANRGYAPKIKRIDVTKIFSIEEMFSSYSGNLEKLFIRLMDFYKESGLKKKKKNSFLKKFQKEIKRQDLQNPLIKKSIEKISKINYFLTTKIHGEFAKEQCLIKKDKIYFVDWNLREGLITEDLVNFFRGSPDYFKTQIFKRIIKNYPKHVKKNLRKYLLMTELIRISKNKTHIDLAKERIKNLLEIKII